MADFAIGDEVQFKNSPVLTVNKIEGSYASVIFYSHNNEQFQELSIHFSLLRKFDSAGYRDAYYDNLG